MAIGMTIYITGPLHVTGVGLVDGMYTYRVATPDGAIALPVRGPYPLDPMQLHRMGLYWIRSLLATQILRRARSA